MVECLVLLAEWRSSPKRVTAEQGSDLALSCTFPSAEQDDIVSSSALNLRGLVSSLKQIVQWLYQNITDKHQRGSKNHWRPLFLNTQSLTPTETRYSIQQKSQHTNQTAQIHSTILTLAKITEADEGLYMCKALSPTVMEMAYNVRVIRKRYRSTEVDDGRSLLILQRVLTFIPNSWWFRRMKLGNTPFGWVVF